MDYSNQEHENHTAYKCSSPSLTTTFHQCIYFTGTTKERLPKDFPEPSISWRRRKKRQRDKQDPRHGTKGPLRQGMEVGQHQERFRQRQEHQGFWQADRGQETEIATLASTTYRQNKYRRYNKKAKKRRQKGVLKHSMMFVALWLMQMVIKLLK